MSLSVNHPARSKNQSTENVSLRLSLPKPQYEPAQKIGSANSILKHSINLYEIPKKPKPQFIPSELIGQTTPQTKIK